ncbi:hypothetical protein [Anaerocaecibacter muris]|uniref:hypothetical protein n=1 Tax=Anaerocaecibacter muris TaxID=2941513 RepID=UPI003F68D974
MNKQKFETKCQELYAYEDDMLAKMEEFVKPLNKELNEYGYKAECHLIWFYHNEEKEEDRFSLERKSIFYKRHYSCRIIVILGSVDYSFFDENMDDEHGVMFIESLTAYCMTILRGWAFSKWECNRTVKNLKKIIEEKNKFGVEYIVKKYKLDE